MKTLLIAWVISVVVFGQQPNTEIDCGFSKLRKRHVSDLSKTLPYLG
jgi:hypothetical protein